MCKSKDCQHGKESPSLPHGAIPISKSHPEIAKLAHGWDPTKFTAGYKYKLPFKCPKGHVFPALLSNKVKGNPDSCAICKNRKTLKGANDLATTHPQIAEQAYKWDPTTVNSGCAEEKLFICKNGHIRLVLVWLKVKLGPDMCAVCSNKAVMPGVNDLKTTHPKIAAQAYGWDPSTVTFGSGEEKDFICKKGHVRSVVVSKKVRRGVDSCATCSNHADTVPFTASLAKTHRKVAAMAHGWDPMDYTAGSNAKKDFRCRNGHIWPAHICSKVKRPHGCAVCNGKVVVKGVNDLLTTHPKVAAKAHGWDPSEVPAGAGVIRDFICQAGHVFPSAVCAKTKAPDSCSVCSGKVVIKGVNDLATVRPDIARMASGWDPTKITVCSNRKLDFFCKKCNSIWPGWLPDVVKGQVCQCSIKYGHNQSKPSFLYLVWRPGQIKYGIMNIWTGRLQRHAKNGWELLDKIELAGQKARSLETTIRQTLRAKEIPTGSKAFRKKFPGYAETFQEVDLCVRSIRGLCRKLGVNLEAFLAS
jgi:hypothetical protein